MTLTKNAVLAGKISADCYYASLFCAGLRIGFAELDYLAIEGSGQARVLVILSEPITENLTVPVMAISFADFFGAGRNLTEHFDDVTIPDPAECKLGYGCC